MRSRREPTEEQRQRAAERRARFRDMVRTVAAMSEAERLALAERLPRIATCEGHALSLHNTILCATQRPDTTLVGGFRQWMRQGRVVRKGEHGLMIWVPSQAPQRDDAAAGDESLRFLMGTVFDVTQTDPTAGASAGGA